MHASAPQRRLQGRLGRLVHALCRCAGVDPRRCLCARCVAARIGLFRCTRVWIGRHAYADVHVLGIRVRHRFAFDQPVLRTPYPAPTFRRGRRRPASSSAVHRAA